jgi:hypothetical protein
MIIIREILLLDILTQQVQLHALQFKFASGNIDAGDIAISE